MQSTRSQGAKPKDICSECGLEDLLAIVRHVEQSDEAAIQLFTRPRSLLSSLGYSLPSGAGVSTIPTEERQARATAPRGVASLYDAAERVHIKAHVAGGLAKCVEIEFE